MFSKPTPPDRGAFPLDLDGECQKIVMEYLDCLRKQKGETMRCRELSSQYLSCRMDNNLMKRDSMQNLGLPETGSIAESNQSTKKQ